MRRALVLLLTLSIAWGLAAPGAPRAQEESPKAVDFDVESLEIEGASGTHRFTVEVARTPEQLARGLMDRRALADESGMLFDLGWERSISMWMKDTYIPLDMLFVGAAGRIRAVHENAEPLSHESINPGVRVRAVLEVNAGTAARLGIETGDLVRHSLFGTAR